MQEVLKKWHKGTKMKNNHTLLLEIKTDKKVIYSGYVLSVTIKDAKGQECFMSHHCDTTKSIRDGIISISEPPDPVADSVSSSGQIYDTKKTTSAAKSKSAQKKLFKVSNAYLSIHNNSIVLFAPDAVEISV